MAKGDSYAASQLFMGLTPKNGYKASKLYCYKPTDGSGDFSWSRNLSSYRLNQSGSLELMGVNVPRIDYTNTCPELLIEKAATNLLLYSEDFSNASWTKTNSTITSNNIAAPNGATTADKLVESVATGDHFVQKSIIDSDVPYVFSVFAKKGEREWILLRGVNAATLNVRAWFDLDNGVIGTLQNGATAEIEDVGNGWYRCSLFLTSFSSGFEFRVALATADAVTSYTGDGTSGAYIWGAQLEKNTYQTSYIPTTSATVTRPQDTNNSNIAFTGNGFSYNLRVRLENRGDLSTPDNIFFIEDNTGIPDVYAGCYVLGDNLTFIFFNAFDIQEFSISLADGIHNIGVSLDCTTGDYEIVIDGVSEFSGTLPYSFSAATDYTKVKLGCISGSTDSIGLNRIIGLQVYDSVLSQADLIEYTS